MPEPSEHDVTALPEPHRVGDKNIIRYRGRCSCGANSYMHYSTPDGAKTALRRTHLIELKAKEDA